MQLHHQKHTDFSVQSARQLSMPDNRKGTFYFYSYVVFFFVVIDNWTFKKIFFPSKITKKTYFESRESAYVGEFC